MKMVFITAVAFAGLAIMCQLWVPNTTVKDLFPSQNLDQGSKFGEEKKEPIAAIYCSAAQTFWRKLIVASVSVFSQRYRGPKEIKIIVISAILEEIVFKLETYEKIESYSLELLGLCKKIDEVVPNEKPDFDPPIGSEIRGRGGRTLLSENNLTAATSEEDAKTYEEEKPWKQKFEVEKDKAKEAPAANEKLNLFWENLLGFTSRCNYKIDLTRDKHNKYVLTVTVSCGWFVLSFSHELS